MAPKGMFGVLLLLLGIIETTELNPARVYVSSRMCSAQIIGVLV